MAKPKRHRSSLVHLAGALSIRVASQCVDADRYEDLLRDASNHALQRAGSGVTPQKLAKALTCGRIVAAAAANLVGGEFERSYYCGINKVCRCCYANLHRGRAEGLGDIVLHRDNKRVRRKLHNIVFRLPESRSNQESLEYSRLALDGMDAVKHAHRNWNRRPTTKPSNTLYEYAMGLHLKPQADSPWLWPHLHLAVIVGDKIVTEGKYGDGYVTFLQQAFDHAVDLDRSTQVKCRSEGYVGEKVLSQSERTSRHRAKAVTNEQLVNTLAYVFRNDEEDDTADSIAVRSKILTALGNRPTFARSRSISSVLDNLFDDATGQPVRRPRTQPTNQFHPDRLGKKSVYLFPFDGPPRPIPPCDYDRELALLLATALNIANRNTFQAQSA